MANVSTPIYYRLVINRGANLQISGIYKDANDNPIDLTGVVAYFVIGTSNQSLVDYFAGESGASVLFATASDDSNPYITLGGVNGTFVIDIDWNVLIDLDPTGEGRDYEQYWWQFIFEYPDGDREMIFYGPCEVI